VSMGRCQAKHTKFQMSLEDWCCPKCGAKPGDSPEFYMFEGQEDAEEDCEFTHPQDYLLCTACSWQGSGTTWSRLMIKKQASLRCTITIPYRYFELVRVNHNTDKQALDFLSALVERFLEKENFGGGESR